MSYPEHEDDGYGPRLFGYLILLFLCAGGFTFAYFRSQGALTTIDANFKLNFLLGFVVWIIFYIFFGRRKGFAMGLISLFALQGAFFIGGVTGSYHQALIIKQWEANLLREISVSTVQDEYGYPKVGTGKFDQPTQMKGEFGEIDRWIRSMIGLIIVVNNDYAKAIEACNWTNILDPARIDSDTTLIESRIIIRKIRKLNAEYRERITSALTDKEKEIDDLHIGKQLKSELRLRMNEGFGSILNDNYAWNIRDENLILIEKIIDLLSTSFSNWSVSNGEIVFDNVRDSTQYREYLSTINSNFKMLQNAQKQRYKPR